MDVRTFEHGETTASFTPPVPAPIPELVVTVTMPLSTAKALVALLIPSSDQLAGFLESQYPKAAKEVRGLKNPDALYDLYFVLDDVLREAKA